MKKKIIIGVLISLLLVIVLVTLLVKYNNKPQPSIVESGASIEKEEPNSNKIERIVKVNGKLYYDTGKESEIDARCGNMDGKIMSNVGELEVPKQDNEANFEGDYGYQYGKKNTIELQINGKWYVFETKEKSGEEIQTALTLEDEVQNNTIWCGTFQLIWNDLKNDLAKQDIKFEPQLQVVENLNRETFTTNDITDKYYYKKYGTPTLELKREIESAIKDKFNEKSDILDDFEWIVKDPEDYFLYTMLKKEFEFKKEFEVDSRILKISATLE